MRKTAIGKAKEFQAEKIRKQNEKVLEANLKPKGDDDSDWESAEEDAPVIKLEELLGNMNIGEEDSDDQKEEDEEEEEEEKNSDE